MCLSTRSRNDLRPMLALAANDKNFPVFLKDIVHAGTMSEKIP